MPAEVVIFLSIGERRRHDTAFRGAQVPVVKEPLLPERFCLPAFHPGGRYRHPIDSSSPVRNVTADFVPALPAEQLALAGNVLVSFEAVGFRIVALFPK